MHVVPRQIAHKQIPPRHAAALLGLVLLPLTGCTPPVVQRTAAFSTEAAPALTDISAAYARVQAVHRGDALARRVDAFDTTSIQAPPPPSTFGTAEDLKVRDTVVALLSSYVSLLADVSGAKTATALDATSRDSAAALARLANQGLPMLNAMSGSATSTKTASSAASATPVSASDTSQGAMAIDALSRIVMEHKRKRALPGILAAADPSIQTLCALLASDFGEGATEGLRHVVQIDYRDWLAHEDAAIRDNASGYSYPEKRAAITALYALQAQAASDDASLARAQAALRDLARTHHALATSMHDAQSTDFHDQLGELALAVVQIRDAQSATSAKAATP